MSSDEGCAVDGNCVVHTPETVASRFWIQAQQNIKPKSATGTGALLPFYVPPEEPALLSDSEYFLDESQVDTADQPPTYVTGTNAGVYFARHARPFHHAGTVKDRNSPVSDRMHAVVQNSGDCNYDDGMFFDFEHAEKHATNRVIVKQVPAYPCGNGKAAIRDESCDPSLKEALNDRTDQHTMDAGVWQPAMMPEDADDA